MPAPVPDQQLPPAVIVNVDATVDHDDGTHRCNGSDAANGRWEDRAHKQIVAVVRSLYAAGYRIHLLTTTRNKTSRGPSLKWIHTHLGVPHEAFHMRRPGDDRGDREVKSSIYAEHIKSHYDVICVLDHQAADTPMWLGHGLICLLVRQPSPDTREGRSHGHAH